MTAFCRLSRSLATGAEGTLWFECPGCKMLHSIQHGSGPGPRWGWNGNLEAPTFTPSILVHYNWTVNRVGKRERVCHSFVTDGRIQFLGDCTHALAGQTVDLPDWDDEA
ncbi:DUF6527 family protein [Pseudomonas fluorescens]|uniref:Ammonia monooxygenase n=1 Tax=Pseudomonas fluorescens TaxID=294 RepID=A0A5E7ECT4_PSEFL|nr:DUF6527 family protein [Pseudomonas fluorescens]VVO24197.1 hypothetical protein PS723_04458 [Pseudomonas fluorescens]